MVSFAAIDFETANHSPTSACSVGIVRVERNRTTARIHQLIRPPEGKWVFTRIHGIRPRDTERHPAFREAWRAIEHEIAGVDFLVAHNASFDARVLTACCRYYGMSVPRSRFVCSMAIARDFLGIRPTSLRHVCDQLSIPLVHHQALSDAEAAAKIVLTAMARGWKWDR